MAKKALVTGASSGIGLATARLLLAEGFEVLGLARDFSNNGDNIDFQIVETDLSDLSELTVELQSNTAFKSPFNLLILNAGYGRFGSVEQFSYDQIKHLVDTNLVSNLFLIKHCLPKMREQGGDIVFIGSESALHGARGGAVYCATKFALRGLAQSLRADLANSNIRVILVNPGPVKTDFFDKLHFEPHAGDEFVIDPQSVADIISHAIKQPPNTVVEEVNLQPLKRSFQKKS